MTDSDFLAAIAAQPAGDAPRLIYADWLDEHGQSERAEFIRVQIELAKNPAIAYVDEDDHRLAAGNESPINRAMCATEDYARAAVLRRREKELEWHTALWGADLPIPTVPSNGYCTWRRGFVEAVSCPCRLWLQRGPTLVRLAATIQQVKLSDKYPLPPHDPPDSYWFLCTETYQHEFPAIPEEGALPQALFAHLKDQRGLPVRLSRSETALYDSASNATKALAQACLDYARSTDPAEALLLHGNPGAPAPQGQIHYPG